MVNHWAMFSHHLYNNAKWPEELSPSYTLRSVTIGSYFGGGFWGAKKVGKSKNPKNQKKGREGEKT
jgi:hypothetical protein